MNDLVGIIRTGHELERSLAEIEGYIIELGDDTLGATVRVGPRARVVSATSGLEEVGGHSGRVYRRGPQPFSALIQGTGDEAPGP